MAATGDEEQRGRLIFAVTISTLGLATMLVGARTVSRFFIVRRVTWDDKVMILAWFLASGLSFTVSLGAFHGLGKSEADISDESKRILLRCEYVFSILYNPALMATKTAILIFYLHLANNTQLFLRYASWTVLAISNLAGFILTVINIFQCTPIQAAWTLYTFDETASCIPLLTEFICVTPINIITDLAILVLPIPLLTNLRLPIRQKTVLVLAFALGVFVTVIGVIRIYYLQCAILDDSPEEDGAPMQNITTLGGQADFSRSASFALMWSTVEVNIGIACACIPTIKPLIAKLFPRLLNDSPGNRSQASIDSQLTLCPSQSTSSNLTPSAKKAATMKEKQLEDEFETPPASPCDNTLFGFVNMTKPINMIDASVAESFRFCAMISSLFFLWGVSYGLIDAINHAVALVSNITTAQSIGLSAAYFGGGYFFGPLFATRFLLRRGRDGVLSCDDVGGYKLTFITGICIYGVGTISFWPSAALSSYPGFLLSNLIAGFGLAVLEVGANAYIILCGPPDYGQSRLLVAQGIQGLGSVVSSLLGQKVLLTGIVAGDSKALINIQWVYLGATLMCALIGLLFYYAPLPEATDDELDQLAGRLQVDPCKHVIGGLQLRTASLVLAVFTQYMYVATQETNHLFMRPLLLSSFGVDISRGESNTDQPPGMTLTIPDYLLLGRTAFTISRLLFGYLTYLSASRPRLPRPHTYLAMCVVASLVLSVVRVVVNPSNPNLRVIPIVLMFFVEAPMWPLLFALGLRGQGRRTSTAAALLTMGGSGSALIPYAMYAIVQAGATVQAAYVVVVAVQATLTLYPAFLTLNRDARRLAEPYSAARHPRRTSRDGT
ncbi:hypothetical protein CDD83_883 [Cordyceps sp. RAO-2017]|nr:hypothetical protein CDD83_883 [Cordyceps sp. RAO-2017]